MVGFAALHPPYWLRSRRHLIVDSPLALGMTKSTGKIPHEKRLIFMDSVSVYGMTRKRGLPHHPEIATHALAMTVKKGWNDTG